MNSPRADQIFGVVGKKGTDFGDFGFGDFGFGNLGAAPGARCQTSTTICLAAAISFY